MGIVERISIRRGAGFGWLEAYVLAALIGFGLLTVGALNAPYFGVDVGIMRTVQSVRTPALDTLAHLVSWVGFPPQSNVVFGLIILALFLVGARWAAFCTLLAAVSSAGLWFLIMPQVPRPRPSADLVPVGSTIPHNSFPSGHVLNLTAMIGFLGFLAYHHLPAGWPRHIVLAVTSVYILAVGYARTYIGEHWPSDVLAGYLLGSVVLVLCMLLYNWRSPRPPTD